MTDLVTSLISEGWLKTPRIIEAFKKIKREDFLPEKDKELAQLNEALPIGFGQTISQPLTVAFMFESLQPNRGDRILDIGSGSGWTTALLAQIVGKEGKVTAVERIPELKGIGENNIQRYNFINKGIIEYICGDGSVGYKKKAPYDKILASAAAQDKIPNEWKEQLKTGGRIVAPLKNSIILIIKKENNIFEEYEYPGFVFVPLIENKK